MPLRNSRFEFSTIHYDEDGNRFVSPPKPIPSWMLTGVRIHTVQSGDTLHSLAWHQYRDMLDRANDVRPSGFWWVIGMVNGIVDPTLPLEVGRIMLIPTLDSLLRILTDRRLASSIVG